jgi:hypothetical protein
MSGQPDIGDSNEVRLQAARPSLMAAAAMGPGRLRLGRVRYLLLSLLLISSLLSSPEKPSAVQRLAKRVANVKLQSCCTSLMMPMDWGSSLGYLLLWCLFAGAAWCTPPRTRWAERQI